MKIIGAVVSRPRNPPPTRCLGRGQVRIGTRRRFNQSKDLIAAHRSASARLHQSESAPQQCEFVTSLPSKSRSQSGIERPRGVIFRSVARIGNQLNADGKLGIFTDLEPMKNLQRGFFTGRAGPRDTPA